MTASFAARQHVSRVLVAFGIFEVMFGCVIGFTSPTSVPHFRAIVVSHIEFTANGVLLAVMGLLTPQLNLESVLLHLMMLTGIVGTTLNGGAFVVSAITGYGNSLSPTMNKQYPPPNGIEGFWSNVQVIMLMTCGVTILLALLLVFIGLVRSRPVDQDSKKGK